MKPNLKAAENGIREFAKIGLGRTQPQTLNGFSPEIVNRFQNSICRKQNRATSKPASSCRYRFFLRRRTPFAEASVRLKSAKQRQSILARTFPGTLLTDLAGSNRTGFGILAGKRIFFPRQRYVSQRNRRAQLP